MEVFGGHPAGERLEKLQDSPYFDGGRFRNPIDTPMVRPSLGLAWEYFTEGGRRVPKEDFPIITPERASAR